jgi:hypothetical protein
MDSSAVGARLFDRPGDRTVMLVAQDMPQLPESQIYRLWAVEMPSAASSYCGQFWPDSRGKAQWLAPSDVSPSQ